MSALCQAKGRKEGDGERNRGLESRFPHRENGGHCIGCRKVHVSHTADFN